MIHYQFGKSCNQTHPILYVLPLGLGFEKNLLNSGIISEFHNYSGISEEN